MHGHDVFRGEYQARALRACLHWEGGKLQTRSGRTVPEIARALGMSRTTLDRYLAGTTPLRSDQFGAFAEAFETDKASLIRGCFPSLREGAMPDPSPEPTLRELLEAAGIPEDEIRGLLSSLGNTPTTPAQRQAIARFVIETHQRRASERSEMRA